MSKKMAGILIAYGAGLAGLGFVLQQTPPAFGRVTTITGFVGGGLCVVWGVAALAGLKGRAWAVLTAVCVAFVLLSQTVHVWTAPSDAIGNLAVRLLLTAMTLLTVGTITYLLHGERPPEFYQTGTARRDNQFSNRGEGQSRDERPPK